SRTAQLQRHRANAGDTDQSTADYYCITMVYSFSDHVLGELAEPFSSDHHGLTASQNFLPSNVQKLDNTGLSD
ncbi:MAG: hypothetical protein M3H12_03220, partial [Chromatiales bacterium]